MPESHFDQQLDRRTTLSMKWNPDQLDQHFGNRNALPFWVADMDFLAPPAVVKRLQQRAQHGAYGYEYKPESYFGALQGWYTNRQNWHINLDHVEACPSVLSAIAILINQHADPGDGVIIQRPVFFEFQSVIRSNDRRVVKNPLQVVDGIYHMDFEDLEAKAAKPKNKIMILCSPHNPVGRVWTPEELAQVVEICERHQVLLIADEIHGDIVYPPHHFTPVLSLPDVVLSNVVACLSPAKTFNLPGMVDAFAVIPDDEKRDAFHQFAHRYQINKTNVFALAAIETAYRDGGPWLDALLGYLRGNIDFIRTYLAEHVPGVSLVEPEGTYLAWLDFSGLEMDAKALAAFLAQEAGLALNPGHWFGREGAGYARMNIAYPRATLEQALSQLATAVAEL